MQAETGADKSGRHQRQQPALLKHGEYVAPEVVLSAHTQPATPHPDAMHGVSTRFSRNRRASDTPSAFGFVWAVYPDAIQLNDAAGSPQMRGAGLVVFVCIASVLIWTDALVAATPKMEEAASAPGMEL